MGLTPKEKKVFEFIEDFISDQGYSPSYREIQSYLELASIGSVQNYIKQLIQKGYLTKGENHQTRALQVVRRPSSPPSGNLNSHSTTCTLPILGSVAAGLPLEEKDFNEYMEVPLSLAPQPDRSFMLRVSGDSMIEAGIFDKDLLLVEERSFADNGSIIVATTSDDEATVKKIFFKKHQVELRPANSQMDSLWYESSQVTIRGLVIGLIRKYGRV